MHIVCLVLCCSLFGVIDLGIDTLFTGDYDKELVGKRVGLIGNHTGINKDFQSTVHVLQSKGIKLVALFSPEHGWDGSQHSCKKVSCSKKEGLPLYSLYGKTRRPNDQMLKNIDILVFDIQDIGVRSYTYATTLFYVMEEAAKRNISIIVLDRPNPINGVIIDGGMLEKNWRSFIGYINVPYCHGMTIGELALFFNREYKIGCNVKVVPMKGWRRMMTFKDTGLPWTPTSPHIPEADTPLFYASTGILGELNIVNIGIGYTLPFKVVGAPWIDANLFAKKLNSQRLGGVYFAPFHYCPFYGLFKGQECHGVLIHITDMQKYSPSRVLYFLIGTLKNLFPQKIKESLEKLPKSKRDLLCKSAGSEEIYRFMLNEGYSIWKMLAYQKQEKEEFKEIRKKYLLY